MVAVRSLAILMLGSLTGIAGAQQKDDALLGRWVAQSITSAIDERHWLSQIDEVVAGKESTFRSVKVPSSFLIEGKDGRVLTVEYRLTQSDKAKGIDLILDARGKPETYRGIYELAGDTLKLCVSLPDEKRPTEFTAKPGSKRVLLILKRPAAEKGELPGHREAVAKGLAWLVKQQHPDGYWTDADGQHKVAMTSVAGIALGMEGSIYDEGKYADNLKRATNWLLRQTNNAKPHAGLIGDPRSRDYMLDHGHALAFLARIYGDIADSKTRDPIKRALIGAVQFAGEAQSSRGGWFDTSRVDGHDKDDPVITTLVLDGLRETRDTGIAVPKELRKKGREYLMEALSDKTSKVHDSRLVLAATLWLAVKSGEFNDPLTKKWLKHAHTSIPVGGQPRLPQGELTHYYYGKVAYHLGGDGWKNLFPGADEPLTWLAYRRVRFEHLQSVQEKDGSWKDTSLGRGPVYTTALNLTVLQLDNTWLPLSR